MMEHPTGECKLADSKIPSPSAFGKQIEGHQGDPRFTQILDHLSATTDLNERVRKILADSEIVVNQSGCMEATSLLDGIQTPTVHDFDLPFAKIEVQEINGHVVYYVQPKINVPPDRWLDEVVRVALGDIWHHLAIEGWCDVAPMPQAGVNYWVWGLLLRNLEISALNRGLLLTSIPQALDKAISMFSRPPAA